MQLSESIPWDLQEHWTRVLACRSFGPGALQGLCGVAGALLGLCGGQGHWSRGLAVAGGACSRDAGREERT